MRSGLLRRTGVWMVRRQRRSSRLCPRRGPPNRCAAGRLIAMSAQRQSRHNRRCTDVGTTPITHAISRLAAGGRDRGCARCRPRGDRYARCCARGDRRGHGGDAECARHFHHLDDYSVVARRSSRTSCSRSTVATPPSDKSHRHRTRLGPSMGVARPDGRATPMPTMAEPRGSRQPFGSADRQLLIRRVDRDGLPLDRVVRQRGRGRREVVVPVGRLERH